MDEEIISEQNKKIDQYRDQEKKTQAATHIKPNEQKKSVKTLKNAKQQHLN